VTGEEAYDGAWATTQEAATAVVVTVAGHSGALPGTGGGSVKLTPFAEYPPKGRATGGVRCQRFLKGEDGLIHAWIGPAPVIGVTESGVVVDLSGMTGKRDGSGNAITRQLAHLGHPFGVLDVTPACCRKRGLSTSQKRSWIVGDSIATTTIQDHGNAPGHLPSPHTPHELP
jgi:hypothetical protein